MSSSPATRIRAALGDTALAAPSLRERLQSDPPMPDLSPLGAVALTFAGALKPRGDPGLCDLNPIDRSLNVITSFPFIGMGIVELRRRTSNEGRVYASSLIAVGLAAAAYHATRGATKVACRKIDYWTIGISASLLSRAIFPASPHWITAASLCAVPFQPFAISAINTAACEYVFFKRRRESNDMKSAQLRHTLASILGLGFFVGEDLKPRTPGLHTCWHLCAIDSVRTMFELVNLVERERKGGEWTKL